MKIVVLGNSGFIGKELSRFLMSNHQVQGISLRDPFWKSQINDDVYAIINLIGKAHDHKGDATEKDFFDVNYEMTKDIFDAFEQSSSQLLIHISSIAAVEEFSSKEKLVETDQCHPVSAYGRSKREAEKFLLEKSAITNKKIIIIRPPMVHGEGDKGNLGLLYNLISKRIPYPLSSFDNSRSFISIDNFCYYIGEIIKKNNDLSSGIYHISDDEPISTKKIIEIIKNVTGKKTLNLSLPKDVIRVIAKIGDFLSLPLNTARLQKMTSNLLVSNQKIKSELQISKMPLTAEQGLTKTIKSFQSK